MALSSLYKPLISLANFGFIVALNTKTAAIAIIATTIGLLIIFHIALHSFLYLNLTMIIMLSL